MYMDIIKQYIHVHVTFSSTMISSRHDAISMSNP